VVWFRVKVAETLDGGLGDRRLDLVQGEGWWGLEIGGFGGV
jgi:hypothetical protein